MVSRERRLRRRAEFEAVRRAGRRVSDRLLSLTCAKSHLDRTRWGLAVSRRVGGAVARNRVKRRIRESIRALPCAEGFDVVVSARPAAAEADSAAIRSSLEKLMERAGLSSEQAANVGLAAK